jgi:hypothetical protein
MIPPNLLYQLMKTPSFRFPKKEKQLLESAFFITLSEGLKDFFMGQKPESVTNDNFNKEKMMFEDDFIILLIEDILATGEYNLEGIAYYTDTHIDVINEIILKQSINPSVKFIKKLMELHRSVRNELYDTIVKRFVNECISTYSQTTANVLPS